MKAIIVYSEYGGPDVLHLAEVAKPVPKADEILIKVKAVSVNYKDILTQLDQTHTKAQVDASRCDKCLPFNTAYLAIL